jgi:hypothetical protein
MKPHKKTELLKGNLLDHWEFEVNNFGGGNQERQMYVDSPEFADMDYSQWALENCASPRSGRRPTSAGMSCPTRP